MITGVSGASALKAERTAAFFASLGVRGLLSWGIAGGLCPEAAQGALLIPAEVATPGAGVFAVNPGLGGAAGRLYGSNAIIHEPAEKARLGERHGALGVDMESHRLAMAAHADGAGLPVFVVRAISDPVHRHLPEATAHAVDHEGRPMIAKVMLALMRRPADLPGMVRAGIDSNRALKALKGAADRIIPEILDLLERPSGDT